MSLDSKPQGVRVSLNYLNEFIYTIKIGELHTHSYSDSLTHHDNTNTSNTTLIVICLSL